MQIKSTENVKTNGVKCLVYGKAGSGKTVLCSTAPDPIILSAESGLLSIAWASLPYIEINTIKDLYEAYKFLTQSKESNKYQTYCLDSVSEIAEVVLAAAKKSNKDARKAYGETQDQILDLMRAFRDLPGKHVYFSAKEEAIKDNITGAITYSAMFPGQKLAQHVPYLFDELFQMFVYVDTSDENRKEYRALRTKADNQFVAKDRSGKLNEWENPNLTEIFNRIVGV